MCIGGTTRVWVYVSAPSSSTKQKIYCIREDSLRFTNRSMQEASKQIRGRSIPLPTSISVFILYFFNP